FTPRLRVTSYDELNAWLLDRCVAYAKANRHPELTDQTIWQVFEAERGKLLLISSRFDGFRATQASVSKTCLVRFDNNKYSVAARAVGRPVEDPGLRRSDCHSPGRRHCRRTCALFRAQPDAVRPWHYVPVLARKPGARCATAHLSKIGCCGQPGACAAPAEGLG